MRVVFLLIFMIIRAMFCGYTTKIINESKGYSGGFLMGVLLAELGILIAAFKKELPTAKPNSFRAVSVIKILKKYHYPLVSPKVEPIDILKGNIYAEAEAAKVNLTFWLIHGLFMLLWYGAILGAYLWYLMGYTIYWLFKYRLFKSSPEEDNAISGDSKTTMESIGDLAGRAGSAVSGFSKKAASHINTEGVSEKAALAKEKAGAAFASIKGKSAILAADYKKSNDSSVLVDDVDEDSNDVTDNTNSAELTEASAGLESFDELYEKAISSSDEVEEYDEISDEVTYSTESSFPDDSIEEPVEEPAINNTPAPVPAPNSAPTASPQQYIYEQKKSPVIYIMAGIIAVLLVGSSILGTLLYMKSKEPDKGNSINNDSGSSVISEEQTTSENTTAAAEEASEPATETVTTAAPEATKAAAEKVDTSAAVKTALKEHLDREYKNENEQQYYFFDRDVKYAVFDVDADGADELFIAYNTTGNNTTDVYLYDNGKYTKALSAYDGGISICLDKHLIITSQHGGGTVTTVYNISSGKLSKIDELSMLPSNCSQNGTVITQSRYNEIIADYESNNLIEIWNSGKPVSDMIDMSAYKESAEVKYTKYDTSAAGSDFEFYPTQRDCKVNTESDDLNLRATPSTNGEVILTIPKNQPVHEYGHDHAWSYISYNKDGKTYYGYVAKQFILDVNEVVQVYSCNKYGTIKVSSGTLSGFKSSYVVDGGQPETVDVTLENGHPIRAVNYCSSKDILWYEVYDDVTGEYCGWFDSDFLNF